VITCYHPVQNPFPWRLLSVNLNITIPKAIILRHALHRRKNRSNNSITYIATELPKFYGIRRYNTMFTRARHWSQFWARCIQSTTSNSISLKYILILFFHLRLGLPSGLFSSGFPTKFLYEFLIFLVRVKFPANVINIILLTWSPNSILWSIQVMNFLTM